MFMWVGAHKALLRFEALLRVSKPGNCREDCVFAPIYFRRRSVPIGLMQPGHIVGEQKRQSMRYSGQKWFPVKLRCSIRGHHETFDFFLYPFLVGA